MKPTLAALFLCVALARPASSAVSLGATVGLGTDLLSGSHIDFFEAPALTDIAQPGLRLGFLQPGRPVDLAFDFGAVYSSLDGQSAHVLTAMANVEANLVPPNPSCPYLTAGLGLQTASGGGESLARPIFGAGLGAKTRVARGAGQLRVEARVDRLLETAGFLAETVLSLRLGFDLFLVVAKPK